MEEGRGRLGEVNKWWLQTLLFFTVPFSCLETLLFWLARYLLIEATRGK